MKNSLKLCVFFIIFILTLIALSTKILGINMNLQSNDINTNSDNNVTSNDAVNNTNDNSATTNQVSSNKPVTVTTTSSDTEFLTVGNILSIILIVIGILLILLGIAIIVRFK